MENVNSKKISQNLIQKILKISLALTFAIIFLTGTLFDISGSLGASIGENLAKNMREILCLLYLYLIALGLSRAFKLRKEMKKNNYGKCKL